MSDVKTQGPSWLRIAGFSCHQGFIFSVFYLGANRGLYIGDAEFERADLFLALVFLCASFVILRALARLNRIDFSRRPVAWACACAATLIAGSLIPDAAVAGHPAAFLLEGALVGAPLAALFMMWGRVLGASSARTAACEVFAATGFAGALCFACAFLPPLAAIAAPKAYALCGAAALAACMKQAQTPCAENARAPQAQSASQAQPGMRRMTKRMLAGAATFGVAAGFMEAYRSDPGMLSTPDFPATLLILALFCIAVLQTLFVKKPAEGETLGSMYRIALLVIMAGFLFAPVLSQSGVTGEAIVLAGYLGLVAAFMAFFLAMAMVSKADAALAFANGLAAIYAGELSGIAAANAYDLVRGPEALSSVIMACAGLAMLFAYLFLFTERDFKALSAIVDTSGTLEKTCEAMRARYGLSARESEVLLLALKGRSNERIAGELFIAKSTADTHLRRIYGKTGAKSRQELIDLGERISAELGAGHPL